MNSHTFMGRNMMTQSGSVERDRERRPVVTVTSESLFQGAQEIAIEHGEAVYRLKITRQGKLILNK